MPRCYPAETRRQVVELARPGTKVTQLATTFTVSEATIYNWLRRDRIDRGEVPGTSTDMALELAAAKRRIRHLETELAVARKVNEVFLEQGVSPKGSSQVIDALAGMRLNVRHACRRLGVSEAGYYAWRSRPASPRALRRIFLAKEIVDVHRDSGGVYGAHRVAAELRLGRQIIVGPRRGRADHAQSPASRVFPAGGCPGAPGSATWGVRTWCSDGSPAAHPISCG